MRIGLKARRFFVARAASRALRAGLLLLISTEATGLLRAQGSVEAIVSSHALERPAALRVGEKLFQELDPLSTGLAGFTNDYRSPRIWGDQWRTYLFGAIGSGVAIGDVDSDGLPDLFAVSKNEGSRLYRNLGDFQFEDITSRSGFADGESIGIDKNDTPGGGVAFADVNNDGFLDLYVCYIGAPNQLWINDGGGRFTERAKEWGVDANTASVMAYFADYDRDGLLDLYLATNLLQIGDAYPGPKPDILFRNTGSSFEDVTRAAGIEGKGHAHSALWWDYDKDGDLDIYVANDFAEADRLYRNNGDGSFENVMPEASSRVPYYAMGSDFGDLNGDGLDEFWVADMAPTDRAQYKRTLESHKHVYAGISRDFPNQFMQNVLLLNLDEGGFTDVASLAGLHRTDWTWAARLVDLDEDGRLDAFATNGMLRAFNDGDLGMRLKGRNNLRNYAQVFKPSPVLEETNLAFRNGGDLRFEEVGMEWGLDKRGVSFGVALGDLNSDGSLDMLVSNFREAPSVFKGSSSGGNVIVFEFSGEESNRFGIGVEATVVAGSMRQTKILNPHRGYMSSDEPILHFGLGSSEMVERVEIRWPSGRVCELGSLEANRRYRIREMGEEKQREGSSKKRFERLVVQLPEEAKRVAPKTDEFLEQALLPFRRSHLVSAAVAGDINHDGRSDLVLGGSSGNASTLLLGGDGFEFRNQWSLDFEEDFPSADASFALADFDGDGDLDLFASSGGSSFREGDLAYQDRLYLGNGDGELIREFESPLSVASTASEAVAAADFDGDGIVDLFVGGGAKPGRFPVPEPSALWRGTGDGGFVLVEDSTAPGLSGTGRVLAAEWADFEGDGYPELVLFPEWGEPRIWRNREGRLEIREDAFGDGALSGLWTSMAVGDFDGDGRLDIAAGNLGLNGGGVWDPARAARRLWWKDDGDSIFLLDTMVESDGNEWPLAWRDRILETRPELPFGKLGYTAFAETPARKLFGDLSQEGYEALELNEPRSGVFWGREDGSFRFEPFSSLAQAGRVVGLLAEDFDKDGSDDLILAVEPVSLAPWTGRAESGFLAYLSGNPLRALRFELPSESGLSLGLQAPRRLLWDDFDGDGEKELCLIPLDGEPLFYKYSHL